MALLEYILRIMPGVALLCAVLFFLPKGQRGLRIMLYIMLFIFVRDAMTPLGLWSFGTAGGFWIRFAPDGPVLLFLGCSSAAMAAAIYLHERDLRPLLTWSTNGRIMGIAVGAVSALIIAAPVLALNVAVPLGDRGGAVDLALLPALLGVTLGGNLYEEFLFRGLLQGYLIGKGAAPARAALLSGLVFAFGHVFLALTVTSAGAPLLVFTLWEGCLLGFVRMRFGILPAALGHGLAIFILASGLL